MGKDGSKKSKKSAKKSKKTADPASPYNAAEASRKRKGGDAAGSDDDDATTPKRARVDGAVEASPSSKVMTGFRVYARERRRAAGIKPSDKAFTATLKVEWKGLDKKDRKKYKAQASELGAAAAPATAVETQASKAAPPSAGASDSADAAAATASPVGLSRAERRKQFWEAKHAAKRDAEGDDTTHGAGPATADGDGSGSSGAPSAPVVKRQPVPQGTKQRRHGLGEAKDPRKRYILFVGNMAYKTRLEDVYKHFGRFGGLIDVRMRTDKKTKKFLGTAFIEYDEREAHGKALGLHHSKLCGREINVELTVGGGGNDARRKEKLREKNMRHLGTGGPESVNSIPLGSRKFG